MKALARQAVAAWLTLPRLMGSNCRSVSLHPPSPPLSSVSMLIAVMAPEFYKQLVSLASSPPSLARRAHKSGRECRISSAAAHYTRVTLLVVYQSEIAAYLPLSLGNHFLLTSIPSFPHSLSSTTSVLCPEHGFRLTHELGCFNDSSPLPLAGCAFSGS